MSSYDVPKPAVSAASSLAVLLLSAFALLSWLDMSPGHFMDWFVGIGSAWWLFMVVVLPWNLHFHAREVIHDINTSEERDITTQPGQRRFAQQLAQRSLIAAILLHIITAAGLYAIAASGVSAVGYVSAGAALLLTGLRPAGRAYEHLAKRLRQLQGAVRYPRHDILTLQSDVDRIDNDVHRLNAQLDPNRHDSWIAQQSDNHAALKRTVERLETTLETLRQSNEAAHIALAKRAEATAGQLSEDSAFLGHVREVLRFVKSA